MEQRITHGIGGEIIRTTPPEPDIGTEEQHGHRAAGKFQKAARQEEPDRDQPRDRQHEIERGQDAPGAAFIEAGDREIPGADLADLADEDLGDQETRYDKNTSTPTKPPANPAIPA